MITRYEVVYLGDVPEENVADCALDIKRIINLLQDERDEARRLAGEWRDIALQYKTDWLVEEQPAASFPWEVEK